MDLEVGEEEDSFSEGEAESDFEKLIGDEDDPDFSLGEEDNNDDPDWTENNSEMVVGDKVNSAGKSVRRTVKVNVSRSGNGNRSKFSNGVVDEDSQSSNDSICSTGDNKKDNSRRNGFNTSASFCDLCSSKFSTDRLLQKHMQDMHPFKPIRECNLCHKIFSSLRSLESHPCSQPQQSPSTSSSSEYNSENESPAPLTPEPSLPNTNNSSSSGPSSFDCTFCPRRFPLAILLKKHLVQHNQPFECDLCPQRFMKAAALNLHKRLIHDPHGMYTYKCLICGKADFLLLSDMYTHRMEQHANVAYQGDKEKAYGCGVCERPYQRRGDAMVCAVLGHQEKGLLQAMFKHKCVECPNDLGYHNLKVLRAHWEKEHNDKPFPELTAEQQQEREDKPLPRVVLDKHQAYELKEKGPPEKAEDKERENVTLILEFDKLQVTEGMEGACQITIFSCPDCPMRFLDVESLRIHENAHLQTEGGPGGASDPKKKGRGRPAAAPPKLHQSPEAMQQPISLLHMYNAMGSYRGKHLIPKFDCKVCGKKFRKLRRLRDHEHLHKLEDPNCATYPKLPGRKAGTGKRPGGKVLKPKPVLGTGGLMKKRGRPKSIKCWTDAASGSGAGDSAIDGETTAATDNMVVVTRFKCLVCHLSFVSEKSLRMHELAVHQAPHRKPGRKPGVKNNGPRVVKVKNEAGDGESSLGPLQPGRIRVGRLEISKKFNKLIKMNMPIKICVTGEHGQSVYHYQCCICPKIFKDKRGIHLHIVGHGLRDRELKEEDGVDGKREGKGQTEMDGMMPRQINSGGGGVQRRTSERERRIPKKLKEYEEMKDEDAEWEEYGMGMKGYREVDGEWEEVRGEEGSKEEKREFEKPTCKICNQSFESVTALWYHGNEMHRGGKVKVVKKGEDQLAEEKKNQVKKMEEGFGKKNPAVLALLQKRREQQLGQNQQWMGDKGVEPEVESPKKVEGNEGEGNSEVKTSGAVITGPQTVVAGGSTGPPAKMATVKIPEHLRGQERLSKPDVIIRINERGEQVKLFKCPKCPKTFKDMRGFPYHALCHLVMGEKQKEGVTPKKRGRPKKSAAAAPVATGAVVVKKKQVNPRTHVEAAVIVQQSSEENSCPLVEVASGGGAAEQREVTVGKPLLSPTSNEFRFRIVKQSMIMPFKKKRGRPVGALNKRPKLLQKVTKAKISQGGEQGKILDVKVLQPQVPLLTEEEKLNLEKKTRFAAIMAGVEREGMGKEVKEEVGEEKAKDGEVTMPPLENAEEVEAQNKSNEVDGGGDLIEAKVMTEMEEPCSLKRERSEVDEKEITKNETVEEQQPRRKSVEITIMNGDKPRTLEAVRESQVGNIPGDKIAEAEEAELVNNVTAASSNSSPVPVPTLKPSSSISPDMTTAQLTIIPKRKRRSPKNFSQFTNSTEVPAEDEASINMIGTLTESIEPQVSSLKRKRSSPKPEVAEETPTLNSSSSSPPEGPPPAKRSRGRPPKKRVVATTVVAVTPLSNGTEIKQENGGYNHQLLEATDSSLKIPVTLASPDIANFVDAGEPKRKRGRPRKSMPVLIPIPGPPTAINAPAVD